MDQGWVKLHRQILENIFLMNDDNAFLVFTKLLLIVNKKNGEYATGRNKLGEMLNMNPRTLYDVLKRLESQHMIMLTSNSRYTVISISKWRSFQNRPTEDDGQTQLLANSEPTTGQHLNKKKKENKNTITNVIADKPVYGNPEVNEMFEYWEQTTQMKIETRIKANRFACSNLLKKHGKEKLERIIGGVAQAAGDQYAPRVSDFVTLQSKLPDLLLWGNKRFKTSKIMEA